MRGRLSRKGNVVGLAVLCLAGASFTFASPFRPQDPLAASRANLSAQNNPVDRARAFPKYGQVLIRTAREAAQAGDYERAEKLLVEYRDTVKQLHESLRDRVPNPEKRPNGFKQLQIHVRKTLRDIEDLVASVPVNLQPPFDFLKKEIDRLDRALVDDLFPRQPNREKKEGKQ